MNAALDLLFGKHGKPALDQIEPGAAGGSEVQMEAGTLGQPAMNQRGFVSSIVVQNQMNLEMSRDLSLDSVEEATEFYRSVSTMQLTEDLAALGIQGREQGSGAVPEIAMGAPLDLTGSHRQQRLGSVQSLNLSSLVNTEHQSTVWRIEIQSDDVTDFVNE